MKNTVIALGLLFASTWLIAGGDVHSKLSSVAGVPAVIDTEQKVYTTDDTNLIWQDSPYMIAEDSAYKNDKSLGKVGTHAHATQYCAHLHYAGHNDWRLPTSDELMQLHHIEGQVFVNFRGNDFWSASPATEGRYYVVFTADAYKFARNKRQSNYIRCVRNK